MSKKKIVSYLASVLVFGIAVLIWYSDHIFGSFAYGEGIANAVAGFGTLVYSFLFASLGFILLTFAILQREDNKSSGRLYKSVNPVILLSIGTIFFLAVYFDVGFNYYGIKNLLYLAAGIIFAFGLGGFLQRLFQKP